jgi:hypothetical protein
MGHLDVHEYLCSLGAALGFSWVVVCFGGIRRFVLFDLNIEAEYQMPEARGATRPFPETMALCLVAGSLCKYSGCEYAAISPASGFSPCFTVRQSFGFQRLFASSPAVAQLRFAPGGLTRIGAPASSRTWHTNALHFKEFFGYCRLNSTAKSKAWLPT